MKLRLRSLESGETQRLEVPSTFTLHQLKHLLLSQPISPSSSSSSPASLLHFSLNTKDELHSRSPETSLQSLGVTSRDLIYYSLDPGAFVSAQNVHSQEPPQTLAQNQDLANVQEPKAGEAAISQGSENPPAKIAEEEIPVPESLENKVNDVNSHEPISKDLEFSRENQENLKGTGEMQETKEVSRGTDVLSEDLGDDASTHKLLAAAVHAVLLESGFVGVDVASGKRIERFHLPDERPSRNLSMSLWYTLPELLNNNSNDNDVTESAVILKFQSLGNFINIYGSLSKGDSGVHRLCLNEHKFAPIIPLLLAKNGDDEDDSENFHRSEAFEFWKTVKDGLALPLSIDLCDRTGLNLPACLMCLPTELKLKILELLPLVDIMKMECVCTEMRYLASSDKVWKEKYEEEFGREPDTLSVYNWKGKYFWYREILRNRKGLYSRIPMQIFFPVYRGKPNPLRLPIVIGDDYEHLPGPSIASPSA